MSSNLYTLSATSPATASAVEFGLATDSYDFDSLTAHLVVTGATGGILNVGLWTSFDGGTTYHEWHRSSDITAGASALYYSVSTHPGTGAQVTRGRWTSGVIVPALTKGTTVPGLVGSKMRVVFETGSGTTLGAAQVILIEGRK